MNKASTKNISVRRPGFAAGLLLPLRVGYFMASRQLLRYGRGTTALIVTIMTLTFLNLVVVSGILVGLIEGSSIANRSHYTGDVFISTATKKLNIARTTEMISLLRGSSEVTAISARFVEGGRLEANYRTISGTNKLPDAVSASVVGIDPKEEDLVTSLKAHVIEGQYLDQNDFGYVLVGSSLLADYARTNVPGQNVLPDVHAGTKVRMTIGDNVLEVTVKGVVKAKVGQVDDRVFMSERDLRKLMGKLDLNANEIAVRLKPGVAPEIIQTALLRAGFGSGAVIQTWVEAQGPFFSDLSSTFRTLGNVIGSIALAVAAMTVFIVVLINALTRKRYIGIMKGFGICGRSISASYVLQSLFYAACGCGLGLLILYGLIKPYFDAHPIDFPFSDGILSVPPVGVALRIVAMFIVAVVAGYVPAQLIVRRNTLDTILGR